MELLDTDEFTELYLSPYPTSQSRLEKLSQGQTISEYY